tara:strand:+ start:524 stop:748 length:225 start_codon:yes stop_codon:yes gene_type:complete
MNIMDNIIYVIIALVVGLITGYIFSYYHNSKCCVCQENTRESAAERELRLLKERQHKAELTKLISEANALKEGF